MSEENLVGKVVWVSDDNGYGVSALVLKCVDSSFEDELLVLNLETMRKERMFYWPDDERYNDTILTT